MQIMRKLKQLILVIILLAVGASSYAQRRDEMVKKIELINTESSFDTEKDIITEKKESFLAFEFSNPSEEFLIKFYPGDDYQAYDFFLGNNSDYEIIDSIFFIENSYYQTKIRFKRIIDNPRLSLKIFVSSENGRSYIFEQALFPIAKMHCDLKSIPQETFVGEETELQAFSNLPENIITNNQWKTTKNIDYRTSIRNKDIHAYFIANKTGNQAFDLYFDLKRPIRDSLGNLKYTYGPLPININVKTSRLAFLNVIKKTIVNREEARKTGIEIQMEYHRRLKMETTYRIEAQEAAGGALVAELFVKSRLSNNKVLCILRPYNFHNQSDGFLYIKEGDQAEFVTNFSIIPDTQIDDVKIMREGGEWKNASTIYPGETLLVRLEGQSLHLGKFTIEDLIINKEDTLINTKNAIEFRAIVPKDVSRKRLQILNNEKPTGKSLSVKEHSKLRKLDYIFVDYGAGKRPLTEINGPEFYNKTIQNIIIQFDHNKIDDLDLHGVQSIDMNIRITGSKGEVYEISNINNIHIAPGANSPRYAHYNTKNCVSEIDLNEYLRRKTYELDDWVKIQLEFKTSENSNRKQGTSKTIDIIVQRDFRFDIDVSFPAGLITKKFDGSSGYGNLSGISMAMLAQFSFYQQDKINRYKPYKVGAGFIAINALNFSENASRDMGVVLIGSLYPTTKDSKMTFPLYFGGGYLLNNNRWFILLGPGIRVRF